MKPQIPWRFRIPPARSDDLAALLHTSSEETGLDDTSATFLQSREGRSYVAVRARHEWLAIGDGRELMGVIDEILDLLES